ncbi:MAG: hypothetical protein PHE17_08885 [Thiothrix sp.]|uniref:hypothetical protein n=1 Tax=Thiothrix sp. TaxID=1032 RepID=UPI0026106045|nr:hypothetical protein [Thiothrix sp.]MDD5393118.1 hypothetical protein [Thiothrix sp.]
MTIRTPLFVGTSIGLALTSPAAFAGGDGGSNDDWFSQFDNVNTSEGFKRHTVELGYATEMPGGRLGVKASQHNLKERDIRYKASEAKVWGRKDLNERVFIEGGLGVGKVKANDGSRSKNLTTYRGRVEGKLSDKVTVGLEHEKDFAFRDGMVADDNNDILTQTRTRADIKYRPSKRVRLEANTERRRLSDGNRARQSKAGAYYGISPDWPWVWTGVEVEHLDYAQEKTNYWTPKNNRSAAVVLDASFPVNEKLELSSGLSVGRSRAAGTSTSNDYGVSLGANYKISKNAKLALDAHRYKSNQNDSRWHENGVTVGVTFDF